MRRTFFIILAGAGGLVALLLIAVAVAVWRVDPNDFVAPIQARIKQATGRDVTIRGGIDLKVSLTPKVVVHDLAVANAPWGRAPQMMTTKQFELEVALLPLLHKRFEAMRRATRTGTSAAPHPVRCRPRVSVPCRRRLASATSP